MDWVILAMLIALFLAVGYGFVMVGNVLNKGFDEILAELRKRRS